MTAPAHEPTGDAAGGRAASEVAAVASHDDGSYTVHGHAAVREAALDDTTFSSAVSRHLQIPNGLDGAEHSRYRALIERYFTPQAMAEFEPLCRQAARESVEALPRGVTLVAGTRSLLYPKDGVLLAVQGIFWSGELGLRMAPLRRISMNGRTGYGKSRHGRCGRC